MPFTPDAWRAALGELSQALDGLAARLAVQAQQDRAAGGAVPRRDIEATEETVAILLHVSAALQHLIRP